MSKAVSISYFKRYEQKYLLNSMQYQELMKTLSGLVVEDEYGFSTIYSLYFDTEDFRIIRKSIEGKVFKEKLRVRSYGLPAAENTVFLELKKKLAGITYKRRLPIQYKDLQSYLNLSLPTQNYIYNEIKYFIQYYKPRPRCMICGDRRAFVGIASPQLRLTFDSNLNWRVCDLDFASGPYGTPLIGCDEYLMELKNDGAIPIDLSRTMAQLKIFPISFSKYAYAYKDFLFREQQEKKHA
ncbi:VTC domain-containing protein [Breznakiellaceae bacterium SP9]